MASGYSIDIWPAGLTFLIIPLIILWRRTHSVSFVVCLSVFSMYVVFGLQKTLFPIQIGGYADNTGPILLRSFVNLIPFYPGPWGFSEGFFLTNLQNVLLTIPFGFGVSFVAHVKAKSLLWLAPGVGLAMEMVQLGVSLLGLYRPYRTADVNDVMMNALGVWIGYGLFRIFARRYILSAQRLGVQMGGLAGYIHEVASRAQLPGS